ncbi:phosphate ABC transporter permease PstA [Actinocorallia sp. A-T 12471]|uniref:phosphate ABC transporter permease PstA n=1 Tax=Actinocorallia sp. A-T 12471 TaxID=3089813 RepID=UPI0029CEEAF4|nr:phosphate ABC transporter permease PstA [Actinocorallia sp. A-T 12471]MDX6738179.1 phosphate ABC transporter permease PstA [Actinocorallia sp. A-T 12471]
MSVLTAKTGQAIPETSTGRKVKDRIVLVAVYAAFALAVIPLVSVLYKVIGEGIRVISPDFLLKSMNGIGGRDAGGGIYHSLVGTLEQVALASAMSIPIAVLTAVYLVEYGQGKRLARTISFFVDVMTGIPSIVAGLFVLAFWILVLGFEVSGFAGSLALAVLMIPTVVRSAEEMLKLVPNELREASYALGVPRWRTITRVVLPTAFTGIITGIMLAIARVMGETAPLLLTIWVTKVINFNPFSGAQSSLPTYIWEQAADPNQVAVSRAWGAALALIFIIMVLNIGARLLARRTSIR